MMAQQTLGRGDRRSRRRGRGALVIAALWIGALGGGVARAEAPAAVEWSFEPGGVLSGGTVPALPDLPIQLIVDDDSPEGQFGIGGATAQQFLWFNQFDRPTLLNYDLEEIWVLFPPGPNLAVGEPIQLVVYVDPDSDPSNGAELLATFDETIQEVDGGTFSVYPLDPPVAVQTAGDLLIGVVSRFVESGVTGPTEPAALDTTASLGRSWLAVWTTDPPLEPALPPDLFIDRVDVFVAGNWMIRGFGSPRSIVEVPTLGGAGLALLAGLLVAAGGFLARRRSAE